MRRSHSLLRSDYLYHFLITDEFNTPEEKIDPQIEAILKEEAERWEWAEYEWVKHKIVSEFMEPKITYYIVEVAGKEKETDRETTQTTL